jgi:hypothetical protein
MLVFFLFILLCRISHLKGHNLNKNLPTEHKRLPWPYSCHLLDYQRTLQQQQPLAPTMTNAMTTKEPGKMNFAGIVGAKRRRMRSGGNVSTLTNNSPPKAAETVMDDDDDDDDDDDEEEKTVQTSKCKGATTIPIFLKSE